jgi:hypothetical protein
VIAADGCKPVDVGPGAEARATFHAHRVSTIDTLCNWLE